MKIRSTDLRAPTAAVDESTEPAATSRADVRAARTDRRIMLALLLVVLGVHGVFAGGHTYSSDEEAIYQTTRSFAAGRSWIEIDDANEWVTAPSSRIRDDGRYVAVSTPGQALASLPAYLVSSVASRTLDDSWRGWSDRLFIGFTNGVVTAAGAAVFYAIARRLGSGRRGGVVLALVWALGTYAWTQARTNQTEPLTALCLMVAVLAAIDVGRRPEARPALVGGAALGVAILTRPASAIVVPLIAVYVAVMIARRWGAASAGRSLVTFAAGGVPPMLLFGVLQWWRFGSPTNLGYDVAEGVYPVWRGTYGLLLSPGKSVFLYAPIVLLTVIGLAPALRRARAEIVLMLAIVVVNILFYARIPFWHGDNAWGPRYLVPVLPFMILPLAPLVARAAWRRAAIALGVVGLVPLTAGILVYHNQYFVHLDELGRNDQGKNEYGWPKVYDDVHFTVKWSPVLNGHWEVLDVAWDQTWKDLFEDNDTIPDMETGAGDLYAWQFRRQIDIWWVQAFTGDAPQSFVALLLPGFVVMSGAGVYLLAGTQRRLRPARQSAHRGIAVTVVDHDGAADPAGQPAAVG